MDHTWATWVTWVMFIHVHQVGSCMSNGKVCFLAIGRTSGPHQLRMRLGPSGEFARYFEPSADVPVDAGSYRACLENDTTMTFRSTQPG